MRFLFCNLNSLPPFHQSGAEITIDEFLEELSEAGHSVYSIICNEIPLLRMGEVRKVVQNGYSRIKSPYCKLFFNPCYFIYKQSIIFYFTAKRTK